MTWDLVQQKPETLVVTRLEFEQRQYEGAAVGDYIAASETTDGNTVLVTATIENRTAQDQSYTVRFEDAESGRPLAGECATAFQRDPLGPGDSKRVQCLWDTSGMAWDDVGKPHSDHQVQVAVYQGGSTLAGTRLASMVVLPKPVIMAHGIFSSAATWDNYKNYLQALHPGYVGRVFAVGDHQFLPDREFKLGCNNPPLGCLDKPADLSDNDLRTYSIEENALVERDYIEAALTKLNAHHADIVAHSMGGLISRWYISFHMPTVRSAPTDGAWNDTRPVITHLVMLGTPNLGSPCANFLPFVQPLSHDLSEDYADYLINVTEHRGVQFSIAAGDSGPKLCGANGATDFLPAVGGGDDYVEVPSALWNIADRQVFPGIHHTQMTGSRALFTDWVQQKLVVGPTQAVATPPTGSPTQVAALATAALHPKPQLLLTEPVTVPAGGSTVVPVQVPAGSALGVILAGPAAIGTTLRDPAGNVVVTIAPDSAEVRQPIRTLGGANPVAGTWTVLLSNAGTTARTINLSAFIVGSPLLLDLVVGMPGTDGRVALRATITDNGRPVPGLPVTAAVMPSRGTTTSLTLYDDGQHGDGGVRDGIYGATTEPLAPELYNVIVQTQVAGVPRLTVGYITTTPPPPLSDALCFPGFTTFCIRGAFRQQWEAHGGLAINGYPLSDEFAQTLEDGQRYQVQYFERVRMEQHPESADPQYRILLGQFGRRILKADLGREAAPPVPAAGAGYDPVTGHTIDARFLAYYQARGDLAQFGRPLTETFKQRLEDGNEYDVQYFERARFEWHPEADAGRGGVLLGQFGRRVLAETPR